MRLFFALFPDAVTRQRLSDVLAQLNLAAPARPVACANFHITLAFVGDVADRDLDSFRRIGTTLALPQCVIELDSCEHWPASQAMVLAARENPLKLAAQTDALRAAVAAQAHHDGIRWRAHATLARKVAQAPVLTTMSPVAWVSQSFSLVRSTSGGNESVYTVVESWPLLDDS